MEKDGFGFLLVLSIIIAPLAAGAFVFSFEPSRHFYNYSPTHDGYVPPRDLGAIVEQTQASTVSVRCLPKQKKTQEGSGWSILLKGDNIQLKGDLKTSIVTNFHVIRNCVSDSQSRIQIKKYFGKWKSASIMRFDKKNDLALLGTSISLKPLELSDWAPYPGYWTMAVGNADGFEGSVAIGNVLQLLQKEVLITNNVSSGNSGGPLVDNLGKVIGTVTWSYIGEQYNGAKSLDAMCAVIIDCEGDSYWE